MKNKTKQIKKAKHLFITDDKIKMYEGDTYYAVDPKNGEYVFSVADTESLNSDWRKYSFRHLLKNVNEQNA